MPRPADDGRFAGGRQSPGPGAPSYGTTAYVGVCWKCNDAAAAPDSPAGLCHPCRDGLRDRP